MSARGSSGKLLAIGLGAGFLAGLMGVGGGVVMVPAMVLLLSMDQHVAHGTSLAIMLVFAAIAAINYAAHGAVHWSIAALLIPGALLGAFLGARAAKRLPARKLALLFAAFVLITGAVMVYEGISGAGGGADQNAGPHAPIWWGLIVGLMSGSLGGLLGVGGGIVIVPALTLGAGLGQQMSQGTSLVAIVATAVSGALTHCSLGNVNHRAAFGLAAGGVPGTLIGSSLANMMGGHHLTIVFGLFLMAMSALIAFQQINGKHPEVSEAGQQESAFPRPADVA